MPTSNHFRIISELVGISMATARIKYLIAKEPKRDYQMRPQLHLILQSNTGSVKSTILREISEAFNPFLDVNTNITMPSVVGTIDTKDKRIVPPVTWDCRNSTLLLDEFKYTEKSELIAAMLQLLEGQQYTRRLGIFMFPIKKEDGDLFFKAKNGKIQIKTRFNMVMATMRSLDRAKSIDLQAFVNRTLLYPFRLTREELKEVAQGKHVLDIKKYDVPEKVIIEKNIYAKILKEVDKSNVPETDYLRAIGDCCRIYAVTKNPKLYRWAITIHSKEYKNTLRK